MRYLLIVLVLFGCSLPTPYTMTPAPERSQYAERMMRTRPHSIRAAFRNGRIIPGMTAGEVEALTSSRYIKFWTVDRVTFSSGNYYEIWRPYKPLMNDDGWAVCMLVIQNGVVDEIRECTRAL